MELDRTLTAVVKYTDMSGLKQSIKSYILAILPKSWRSCAHQVRTQLNGKKGSVLDLVKRSGEHCLVNRESSRFVTVECKSVSQAGDLLTCQESPELLDLPA